MTIIKANIVDGLALALVVYSGDFMTTEYMISASKEKTGFYKKFTFKDESTALKKYDILYKNLREAYQNKVNSVILDR